MPLELRKALKAVYENAWREGCRAAGKNPNHCFFNQEHCDKTCTSAQNLIK